jgi:hypothetical protein
MNLPVSYPTATRTTTTTTTRSVVALLAGAVLSCACRLSFDDFLGPGGGDAGATDGAPPPAPCAEPHALVTAQTRLGQQARILRLPLAGAGATCTALTGSPPDPVFHPSFNAVAPLADGRVVTGDNTSVEYIDPATDQTTLTVRNFSTTVQALFPLATPDGDMVAATQISGGHVFYLFVVRSDGAFYRRWSIDGASGYPSLMLGSTIYDIVAHPTQPSHVLALRWGTANGVVTLDVDPFASGSAATTVARSPAGVSLRHVRTAPGASHVAWLGGGATTTGGAFASVFFAPELTPGTPVVPAAVSSCAAECEGGYDEVTPDPTAADGLVAICVGPFDDLIGDRPTRVVRFAAGRGGCSVLLDVPGGGQGLYDLHQVTVAP